MKLDKIRLARYRTKTSFILANLNEIQQSLPIQEPQIILRGIYYNLFTAIESAMDIAALLVKDLGRVLGGDRQNVATLTKIGIISNDLEQSLLQCNGLRNILFHRYNGVDNERVIKSIPEVDMTLGEFVECVENALNQQR
ncbi:MAG: DUF86 domain-containing protein [Candidatus Thorarchaeota archaeon]